MTHQEKLDFVISKVHEAVPEIKELKFGCNVEDGYGEIWTIIRKEEDGYEMYMQDIDCRAKHKYQIIEDRIIGRKIGIADIMLTLSEKYDPFNRLIISTTGHFYKQNLNGLHIVPGLQRYDFHNDDITKQSEELVDFLYNLFK